MSFVKTWVLVVLAVVVGLFIMKQLRRPPSMPPEKARQLVDRGAVFVDVRTPGEFDRGHLASAINAPLGETEKVLRSQGIKKDAVLVLYCASGIRSATAASRLRSAGFQEVYDIGTARAWPLPAE